MKIKVVLYPALLDFQLYAQATTWLSCPHTYLILFFSSEVTVIIFVQWVVGLVGFRLTYKVDINSCASCLVTVSRRALLLRSGFSFPIGYTSSRFHPKGPNSGNSCYQITLRTRALPDQLLKLIADASHRFWTFIQGLSRLKNWSTQQTDNGRTYPTD